jgi:broad specificity phosphatase PhoE
MILYLIRHGQSVNNARYAAGDDSRIPDAPLTDIGKIQAEHTAIWLKDKGITVLYSSPMRRALQTAQVIGDALELPTSVWVDLHELFGVMQVEPGGKWVGLPGMSREEMAQDFPKAIIPEQVTSEGWRFGELESLEQAYDRAKRIVSQIEALYAHTDERVVVVSHGGFGSYIMDAFLKLPFCDYTDFIRVFGFYNASITMLEITPKMLRVCFLDYTAHLPKEMIT